MVDTAILDLVSAANGDRTQLTLMSVDLCFAALSREDRERIRGALEAAAIPHWCDDDMLAALLGSSLEEAATLMSLLRQLPVVEAFPARGVGAANVHEASRIQLRQYLRKTAPERVQALSRSVAGRLAANESAHARMEVLYHRFSFEPVQALEACDTLVADWQNIGRHDVLLALATALVELIDGDFLESPICAAVCLHVAQIWYHFAPLGETERQVQSALAGLEDGGDPWRLARAHDLLGDVRRDQGQPAAALDSYRAALTIRQKLLARNAGNGRWLLGLSASHRKVGEVLGEQGHPAAALAAYADALTILNKLAAKTPADPELLHQLCVTHQRVGDVRCASEDLEGALEAYRAARAVAESLTARDVNNPRWQRDLFTVYYRLGKVLHRSRAFSDALTIYRAALATAERFAIKETGDTERRTSPPDPAAAAGPRAESDKDDAARSVTVAATPSTDRLFAPAKNDTARNDTDWQRNVSVAHQLIGDVLREQGDLDGALAAYRSDFAIAARLAAGAPANKRWQHDLSVSHERIGDLLRKGKDFAGAINAYQASLAIRDHLARKDPDNAEWRRDFAISCGRIVTVLCQQPAERPGEIQRWLTRGFNSLASIAEAATPREREVRAYLEQLRRQSEPAVTRTPPE